MARTSRPWSAHRAETKRLTIRKIRKVWPRRTPDALVLTLQGDALQRPYIEKWVVELGLEAPWTAAREAAS